MFKTKLALDNWGSKYAYRGETPIETFSRAAQALASVEKPEVRDYWQNQFLEVLVNFNENGDPEGLNSTLGGRITANIGTDFAATTLMNCFINGPVRNAKIIYTREIPGTDKVIDNTMSTQGTPDSLGNIMLTLLEQAETLKSEGGYGINFSFIRPRGSVIEGVGIEHPGVIKYMEIWDKVSDVIVMGNNDGYKDTLKNYLKDISKKGREKLKKMARKGAMMGCLNIWHPDIEEFIRAKQQPGKLTKFNISVLVDDKFMNAVNDDEMYDLHFNGVVFKTVRARDLYDLIMQSTYNRAEPGVLFYNSMQRNNPLDYLGEIDCTNPCGEIGGNPVTSTVCLLGSLNLTMYVCRKTRKFLWEKFKRHVAIFARMLDNVNDLSEAALPQYRWAIENIRQYGMGINGLGSALYMMGVRYGSPEAVKLTDEINWWKEEICWRTSAELAVEKGPFPAYNEKFLETYWFTKFTRISDETKALIRKNGVRNGKTTTNPPLGNSSVICDMVSNGIEPVFMHEYKRTYIVDKWPDGLTRENVVQKLTEIKQGDATVWQGNYQGVEYHYEPHNRGLCVIEIVRDYGYQWVMDNFPQDIEGAKGQVFAPEDGPFIENKNDYLVTTEGLSVYEHVQMQAVVQQNINQSVSKTANIPAEYPFEDFKQLYMHAWEMGLNGFTTYRDGSMEAVLSKIDKKEDENEIHVIRKDIKLPEEFVNGPTRVIKREGRKFYIHFSYLNEDSEQRHPCVMWIDTNSEGGDLVAVKHAIKKLVDLLRYFEIEEHLIERQLEKIKGDPSYKQLGKIVSMGLRHNLPIVNTVVQLENLEGDYISSLLTAVRKFLSSHVKDGTRIAGKNCTACSGSNLKFESGCSACNDCGASNCG
jgi:ribonucleoside-diphosphate reductase alpha chain